MNKNVSLAFNVVLLILVGVLFYLHFSGSPKKASTQTLAASSKSTSADPSNFNIAYFEMDSIENNYTYLKDIKNQLKTREQGMSNELNGLKKRYFDKVNKFQQEAQTMTQERQGMMQQELMNEQKTIQNKEQGMGAEFQEESYKKMQDVNRRIEEYLKEYNKDKGYSYILAYQPGTIYYKDAKYDITSEVLKGLNESYKKK
jgi:outer membrane protein